MADADFDTSKRAQRRDSIRLSRISVHTPTLVSAENNVGARKNSDSTDISPKTSYVELAAEVDQAETPKPQRNTLYDQWPDSVDDLSRRGSTAEPAGSGMPPAEITVFAEKEVVLGSPQEDIPAPRGRIRSAFLELPQDADDSRILQSPMPSGQRPRLPSIDANSAPNMVGTSALGRRVIIRASISSEPSPVESRDSPEDGANAIFQAARQARLKRPSLVNHPAAGGSGIQLADLAKFIKDRDLHSSETMEHVDAHNIAEHLRPSSRLSWELGDTTSSTAWSTDRQGEGSNPPNTARGLDLAAFSSPTDPISLQDALRLNPIDPGTIPRRSFTVPASIGAKRKTRFEPLSIDGKAARAFRRDSIVTTPYPKLSQDVAERSRNSASLKHTPRPIEFNLTISARNRISTVSVPQFGSPEPRTKTWWNAKAADDRRLVELAKTEYAGIQGKIRHFCGAKTAKSVRMRFVRSNKSEHFREPDSPLIGGRWNSYAESDFWQLWIDPAQGRGKRDWLDILTNHSRIYGPSRSFVVEVVEGYDAVRLALAFFTITVLSLLAMLLWLFVGIGGEKAESGTFIDAHGAVRYTHGKADLTMGNPGTAFILGIWVLSLGWTGVGAWIYVS